MNDTSTTRDGPTADPIEWGQTPPTVNEVIDSGEPATPVRIQIGPTDV